MKIPTLLILGLFIISAPALAQIDVPPYLDPPNPSEAFASPFSDDFEGHVAQEAYGTAAATILPVSAWDFVAPDADQVFSNDGAAYRYVSAGGPFVFAPLQIPTGVLLTGIEIQGCDTNPTSMMTADVVRLFNNGTSSGYALVGGQAQTGDTYAGGCSLFFQDISSAGHVTDNTTNMYHVRVFLIAADSTQKFAGIRVYYKRVISPAPGTATFTDVPTTHPLHQFVEALAASGITSGCGEGNFCPNATLTRGQMAVFLSKALGLHWAN